MTIKYSPGFFNKLREIDVRIQKRLKERILIFSKNPNNLQLNNHALKREYEGYRSIDITADWRALYKEIRERDENIAYFVLLGTHKQLYG